MGVKAIIASEGVHKHPKDINLRIEDAENDMKRMAWLNAIKKLKTVMDFYEGDVPASIYLNLFYAYRGYGNLYCAENILIEGMEKNPENEKLAIEHAELAMEQQDWEQALWRWEEFRKIRYRKNEKFRKIDFVYNNDLVNKLKYGKNAPIYAERIWINYRDCEKIIPKPVFLSHFNKLTPRKSSGLIIDNIWPSKEEQIPIKDSPRIKNSIDHWLYGVPWKDTGEYEIIKKLIDKYGSEANCYNMDDIIERYKKLDNIYSTVKKEGRIKTRRELKYNNFREEGGILIHIGPSGELFFGMGGAHRMAIALILNLRIPAQIGCVHKSAIHLLPLLRKGSF